MISTQPIGGNEELPQPALGFLDWDKTLHKWYSDPRIAISWSCEQKVTFGNPVQAERRRIAQLCHENCNIDYVEHVTELASEGLWESHESKLLLIHRVSISGFSLPSTIQQ